MLYMVEMDMPHVGRLAAWHQWYDAHVKKLLTMPGFVNAQRFVSIAPTTAPYLAVYTVIDGRALDNPTYNARAGPGSAADWAPYMNNWRRNLLDGCGVVEGVAADGWLAVFDRHVDSAPPLPTGFVALSPRGLDGTVVERGWKTGAAGTVMIDPDAGEGWNLRVFRPLSGLRRVSTNQD